MTLSKPGLRHGLAAERIKLDRRRIAAPRRKIGELLQIGRRKAGVGDALLAQYVERLLGGPEILVTHHERGAAGQRGPEPLMGAVERKGQEVQFARVPVHIVERSRHLAMHRERSVLDRDPLRDAGGARGVDDIRKACRFHRNSGIALGLPVKIDRVEWNDLDPGRWRSQCRAFGIDQHETHAGVAHGADLSLRGMLGIERQIGCAGLQYGQQRYNEGWRTPRRDADQVRTADAETDQAMCEPIGATVELGIGDHFIAEDERRGIGRFIGQTARQFDAPA